MTPKAKLRIHETYWALNPSHLKHPTSSTLHPSNRKHLCDLFVTAVQGETSGPFEQYNGLFEYYEEAVIYRRFEMVQDSPVENNPLVKGNPYHIRLQECEGTIFATLRAEGRDDDVGFAIGSLDEAFTRVACAIFPEGLRRSGLGSELDKASIDYGLLRGYKTFQSTLLLPTPAAQGFAEQFSNRLEERKARLGELFPHFFPK